LQLGRYQILKQLSTGDVADVLLARATGLEGFARHVVIKCIRPELAGEQRLVESFIEEARIAASLHHQNIVQVHDIGEQGGAYFFAMEYVHGEDVRQLLARISERGDQVPLDHVVAIITATAAGLQHAHEQRNPAGEHLGLVHRDVCPANILLGYDGSVKLVDFGMAKAALRSVKTASGSLKGKASYMSPEQCMGKTVDRRTDTFALGIVLYELATARRLYKAANEFLTMAAIVEGSVPPPSTYRSDLPATFDSIALRALAREPELRYQTAEDLRAALEQFAVEQQLRTSNKALADYFNKLFGQRIEPWLADSEVRAVVADFDSQGLVDAAGLDDSLIAKYAPRSTAPIMLAQSIAARPQRGSEPSLEQEWSDDEDHIQTIARKPTAEDMALLRPSAPESPQPPAKQPEEDFGATVISPPPIFDDGSSDEPLEQTTSVGAEDEVDARPRAATLSGPGIAPPPQAPRRDLTPPPRRDPTPPPRRDPLPPSHHDALPPPPPTEPPRAPSEHMYVGPPAPAPPGLDALIRQYRKPIAIGAAAGLIILILAIVGVRSCGSDGPQPPKPAGSGSAR
jgi:eukaryotic-like serine/threonine-protein kinase